MKKSILVFVAVAIAVSFNLSCAKTQDVPAVEEAAATGPTVIQDKWMSINWHPKDRDVTTVFSPDLGYNRHYVVLEAVTPNPDSPMKGLKAEGNTSIMFTPAADGESFGPENITYQHAGGVWIDPDGDMIFLYYEFKPPAEPHIWVAEGLGKFAGLKGDGKWHWNWPEGWEKPEIPEGFEYPNAYEFTWTWPDPAAEPERRPIVGSTICADGGGDLRDKVVTVLNEPAKWRVERELPNGNTFVQAWIEGSVVSAEPGSPLEGLAVVGQSTEAVDGDHNIIYQTGMLEFTAEDGSQIFMFAESRPPADPHLWVTAASGRFSGLEGDGKWLNGFPEGWVKPEVEEGAGEATAWEFAWNLPKE